MTRIVDVSVERVSVPLHTPFVTALRRTETTETVLVRVTDSDGATGWGEAPQVWQVTGESLAGAEACVTGPLAQAVLGTDADDLAATCRAVAGAVAANFGAKGGARRGAARPRRPAPRRQPAGFPRVGKPPGRHRRHARSRRRRRARRIRAGQRRATASVS